MESLLHFCFPLALNLWRNSQNYSFDSSEQLGSPSCRSDHLGAIPRDQLPGMWAHLETSRPKITLCYPARVSPRVSHSLQDV